MKVKDMNKEQRPREHALQDGIEHLTTGSLWQYYYEVAVRRAQH